MKTIKTLFLTVSSLIVIISACAKADAEFLHEDCEISAIYITPAETNTSKIISGIINNDTGEIKFPIPRKERSYYDLAKLKVRANVAFDAMIEPSLSGIKDLSEPFKITVTASSKTKTYTLNAYYER